MITDATRLLRIADRLDIEVIENAKHEDIPVPLGPQGHACCTRRRRVYVHELSDGSNTLFQSDHVAYVFHELMHVYLQPPWWRIDEVPEEMLILPVERTIARARFSHGPRRRRAITRATGASSRTRSCTGRRGSLCRDKHSRFLESRRVAPLPRRPATPNSTRTSAAGSWGCQPSGQAARLRKRPLRSGRDHVHQGCHADHRSRP